MTSSGTLYIVPTPIGNLKDITLRALDVLAAVDLVAAEDTRNTKRLLTHFDISKPLMSYHDHSERSKSGGIIEQIKEGKNIALVSDGGMPLISDPGYHLVQKAIEEDIELVVLPGPSAAINALVASGLAVDRFVFEGYLSRSPQKRRKRLRELIDEERTMIFYESPHRILKTLADMQTLLGERKCAVLREMTKKFEEHFRGMFSETIAYFTEKGVKGEFVVVVSGKASEKKMNKNSVRSE